MTCASIGEDRPFYGKRKFRQSPKLQKKLSKKRKDEKMDFPGNPEIQKIADPIKQPPGKSWKNIFFWTNNVDF